jgi:hypothetical protein
MGNGSHRLIQVIEIIHPIRKNLETLICGTYYSTLPSRATKKMEY